MGGMLGLMASTIARAQSPTATPMDNHQCHWVRWNEDSIRLDTASAVPHSLRLETGNGELLPPDSYRFYWLSSHLVWKVNEPRPDSVWACYRRLRYDLSKPIQRYAPQDARYNERQRTYELGLGRGGSANREDNGFAQKLQRRGAVSRGVSVGNAQNVSMTSNLDLQLSGPISEDFFLEAALTDNQLPVQPEGNSARVQEFDQLFIRVYNEQHRLTLGDFRAQSTPQSHFLQFQKKGRGLDGQTELTLPNSGKMTVNARLALSRGQFARNTFQGEEGNQGPYNLRGNDGARFITVLSGTERVFLNGKQMQRGRDADYVIDYNTGTLTFNSRHLISTYDRIVVEFQYTGQAYDRSMQHVRTQYRHQGWEVEAQVYNEQDSRSRPLFRTLSDDDLFILGQAGDGAAFSSQAAADSLGFEAGSVRYRKTDTLDFGEVFVYSTRPESAVYRVRFAFVGEGNGHYLPVNSSVNGQVFRWVKPRNGRPQGSYSPNSRLIAPEKRSMLSASLKRRIVPGTKAGIEVARSTYDQNTFSVRDSADDHGNAVQAFVHSTVPLDGDSSWRLQTRISQEWKGQHFQAVERYRDVEFSRYWDQQTSNPADSGNTASPADGLGQYEAALIKDDWLKIRHRWIRYRRTPDAFTGDRHRSTLEFNRGADRLELQAGWTRVNAPGQNMRRYRRFQEQSLRYTRSLAGLRVGGHLKREHNIYSVLPDETGEGSYQWQEGGLFVGSPDTVRTSWELRYRNRRDRRWTLNKEDFQAFTRLEEYQFGYHWRSEARQHLEARLRYRHAAYPQEAQNPQQGHHYTADLAHRGKLFEDWVTTSTQYVLGSGRVQRQQYVYVEVAPGQGVYTWIDFNDNGVQEQDEFERAAFKGDARFVRVVTPTNEFIPSQSHEFRQQLEIYAGGRGIAAQERSFWERFSSQSQFHLSSEQYRLGDRPQLWPSTLSSADTQLLRLSQTVRQSIHFNRNHPVAGLQYQWRDNNRRQLLSGGEQTTRQQQQQLEGRWNFAPSWELRNTFGMDQRSSVSAFLRNQNYQLQGWDEELTVRWHASTKWQTSVSYQMAHDRGDGAETPIRGRRQELELQCRWGMPSNGSLQGSVRHSRIQLQGNPGSSAAYQILQGLRPGANWVLDIRGGHKLSDHLFIDVHLNTRISGERAPLHTGSMSARWAF